MKTRQGDITVNDHEQQRLVVLNAVLASELTPAEAAASLRQRKRRRAYASGSGGELTPAEAAASLGLSPRHVRRVLGTYRRQGGAALVHGNRGRRPGHATQQSVARQVVALARTTYAGRNQQHLRDLLAEREGIALSRATIHRLLTQADVLAPARQRPPQHRRRRERRQQAGQLVQIDGSPHAWLEDRGPTLSLLGAIDDATGKLLAAVFREQEDTAGYFALIEQLVRAYGRPLAFYHDRHRIFRVLSGPSVRHGTAGAALTLADELAGRAQPLTQFGRLLEELVIGSIAARSPQAKGRVERLWGTLQDRLVVELRLAGAADLGAANAFLRDYLPRFNAQFAVPAVVPTLAYRPLDSTGLPLEQVCCFKYARTVAADNTGTFAGQRLQLLPDRQRRGFAHASVEVHERLHGSLRVVYAGACLHSAPAPLEAPRLRARRGPAPCASATQVTESAAAQPPPAGPVARPPRSPSPSTRPPAVLTIPGVNR